MAALCAVAAVLLHLLPHRAAPQPAASGDTDPRPVQVTNTASAPVRLRIPALGVSADILPLGLDTSGALEVPGFSSSMKVGWYAMGPRPGERGPAVFVGHRDAPDRKYVGGLPVDSGRVKNAVFARLGRLQPGELVEAELGNGRRVPFRVTAVDTYPSKSFPTERVYGPAPEPQLRLITCGGVIDGKGHWDSNVVVSAEARDGAGTTGKTAQRAVG